MTPVPMSSIVQGVLRQQLHDVHAPGHDGVEGCPGCRPCLGTGQCLLCTSTHQSGVPLHLRPSGLSPWLIILSTPSDQFHEDSLFPFQGDSFCCSQLKHLWGQQGEVCIVICSPWMVCSPQQCIRPTHLSSWLVGQDKVKPGEVQAWWQFSLWASQK